MLTILAASLAWYTLSERGGTHEPLPASTNVVAEVKACDGAEYGHVVWEDCTPEGIALYRAYLDGLTSRFAGMSEEAKRIGSLVAVPLGGPAEKTRTPECPSCRGGARADRVHRIVLEGVLIASNFIMSVLLIVASLIIVRGREGGFPTFRDL